MRFGKLACAVLLIGTLQGQYRSQQYEQLPLWPKDGIIPNSLQQNYVFRDENTAEIVVSFPGDEPAGPRTVYRYRPQNQVEPHVGVTISRDSEGHFRYLYTVENAPTARQGVDIWSVVSPGPDSDIIVDHPSWAKVRARGSHAKQAALPGLAEGEYIDWVSDKAGVIAPGTSVTGFSLVSSYSPGFTTAFFQGGKPLGTKGDLPVAVVRQLAPLMKIDVNSRPAVTIGPRFAKGTSRAIIAEEYRSGIQTLVKEGVLDRQSGFVQNVTAILAACGNSAAPCLSQAQTSWLESVKGSREESEIAAALVLSLH
jgi:hypothetical protein